MSDSESSSEDDLLAAVAALPPHMLTEAQQAAIILQVRCWADLHLLLPHAWNGASRLLAGCACEHQACPSLLNLPRRQPPAATAPSQPSLPPHHPPRPQAWENAAHTKPANFDAGAQLMVPGLADVAVVSRGGWQRHSWKGCNQDSFLALPLAVAPPSGRACADCPAAADCGAAALAIGVFDGHGRAGAAASAHLRNALASGLLMHNQLAQAARRACAATGPAPCAAGEAPSSAATAAVDPADEAAQLLERCFAAAASTMPSTGADFSLSGSTAVMCLVQPGRWVLAAMTLGAGLCLQRAVGGGGSRQGDVWAFSQAPLWLPQGTAAAFAALDVQHLQP